MPTHTKTDGTIEHRSEDGLRHCVEGPAVTRADGSQEGWLNGQPHRLDGPAIEGPDRVEYRVRGKLHRADGPALIVPGVLEAWYLFDMPHRDGGPAVLHADGTAETWVAGKQVTA